jgi:hypothetical protein
MKPVKNKVFCNNCNRAKMLFETEKKAANFIRFNKDEIEAESGIGPQRAYYCLFCGGWHITHYKETRGKTRNEKLFEVFNPAKDESEYHIESEIPKEKPKVESKPEKKRNPDNRNQSNYNKPTDKLLKNTGQKAIDQKPLPRSNREQSNREKKDVEKQLIEKQINRLDMAEQDKYLSKNIYLLKKELKILTDPVALNKKIKDLKIKLEINYTLKRRLNRANEKKP